MKGRSRRSKAEDTNTWQLRVDRIDKMDIIPCKIFERNLENSIP
jgi:hypothetical protein